jgi:membrane protein required for colicin V production
MTFLNSYYDIAFFGIIAFSTIFGFIRGGLSEILSLGSWLIAFWLMHNLGNGVEHLLPNSITNHLFRNVIAFIIIFVVVAIFIAIIKKILSSILTVIGLNGLNYLIGIVFGVLRGILICAVLVIIVNMLSLDQGRSYQKSKLFPILAPVISWISSIIPNKVPAPPTDMLNSYKNHSESYVKNLVTSESSVKK